MRAFFRLTGIVVLALLLLAGGAALWLRHAVYDDRAYPRADTKVVIPSGSGASAIGALLRSAGVIGGDLPFRAYVRLHGGGRDLRAGEFLFPAHESVAETAQRLTTGGAQLAVWVTIPEGYTAREIAQVYALRGFGEEPPLEHTFLSETLKLPGGETSANLEGYLYPDTYLTPIAAGPREIARQMTDEFSQKLPPDAAALAKRLGYTIPQIVTIASMIEREGKADDERPTIASVIYNRLRLGMRLQIDATIEYTFAEHKDVITQDDLARESPYNTYLHDGLPPTPIASPGEPSIAAAFHPASSPYLYYVYMGTAGNGHHAFARTLAEHNANVQRYEP